MLVLILGLVIFLGAHSVRIFAEPWRTRQVARLGANGWKGAYSLTSAVGFVLIVWGYGMARHAPIVLWTPPVWGAHLTGLLTLIAFVFFVAAYVPGNHFKAWVGHPMALSAGIWAVGHLFSNGTLNAVVLMGAFLIWSVLDFAAGRRRDAGSGVVYPAGAWGKDLVAVVVGLVVWVLFVGWLHVWLIGVRPGG
jgi:uncharacterized membrane protein